MRRHRVLLLLWAINIACFGLGFLGAPGLSVAAQFVAFILAAASVKRAELVGELRRPLLYRASLLLLLAAAATVLAAAGSTVAYGDANPIGFIALACTNLVVAVLAWRALTRPAPRRAAVVGLIAVIAELFALVFDVVINLERSTMRDVPDDLAVVAVFASWGATWVGAFVCMVALVAFDPADMVDVPDARVVD